jgi:hypothetical protein
LIFHNGSCTASTTLPLEQLRKQARERRQYVYAKSLEAQERLTYERKRQLKDALASGKPLPTELRKDVQQLSRDLAFDEAQTGKLRSLCDTGYLPDILKIRLLTSIMSTPMLAFKTQKSS